VSTKALDLELAALVPGLEPFDGALGSVECSSSSKHQRLELHHHIVDEAQLDDEERWERQLLIHNTAAPNFS
jgi:hypothetical protein